jgi:aminoglycoside phosphotransferase (APT) family kinase protein
MRGDAAAGLPSGAAARARATVAFVADLPGGSAVDIAAGAFEAVKAAADGLGVSTSDARLLRIGSNAVFDLGDVVARVTLPGARTEPACRAVALARWLEENGVPAVLALDVEQPRIIDGVAVTFWESMGQGASYGTTSELAELLRRLHALDVPAESALPGFAPLERLDRRLESLNLPETDVAFLRRRADHLRAQFADLHLPDPPVVLHGDANVGNVLHDRAGVPRLIDLDSMCRGPREWDLVLTALYYERLGWHTGLEYRAFCATYGRDVRDWHGYETFADMRELLMVSWIAAKAGEAAEMLDEATKRIRALQRGLARDDWLPI